MHLQLSNRPGRDCTVVEVAGDLDIATEPRLRDELRRLFDTGHRHMVVDLGGVSFMDSSGLGTLVVMFKVLRKDGGWLRLAGVQPPVRTVLQVTSVDQVIEIYDTVEAAEGDHQSPLAP